MVDIHSTHRLGKPWAIMTDQRKDHWTESNAFLKLILEKIAGLLPFAMWWSNSLVVTKFSEIWWPCTNAVWLPEISSGSTSLSLLERILDISFGMRFNTLIESKVTCGTRGFGFGDHDNFVFVERLQVQPILIEILHYLTYLIFNFWPVVLNELIWEPVRSRSFVVC